MSERAPNVPERVHLVGIGGAHMSAIAQILHAWGHTVRGSDQPEGVRSAYFSVAVRPRCSIQLRTTPRSEVVSCG